jgi:predicted RND superfamily exporter protein
MDTLEKMEEYADGLDKRTKEYKDLKEKIENKKSESVESVADVIENVAKATGLDKVAEVAANLVGKEDCGCEERKLRMKKNPIFNFTIAECPNEEDFNWLKDFFAVHGRVRVTREEQMELIRIYNYVFSAKKKPSQCGTCVKGVMKRLKRLLDA